MSFEEKLRVIPATHTAADQQTVGWLLLVGITLPTTKALPPPEAWRVDGSSFLSFFDWLAWNAGKVGWEEALRLGEAELDTASLALISALGWVEVREWLRTNWVRPPEPLLRVLRHPRIVATKERWLREREEALAAIPYQPHCGGCGNCECCGYGYY